MARQPLASGRRARDPPRRKLICVSSSRKLPELYHGGEAGLVPGQKLLPPSLSGARSCADLDSRHCRPDRVYLTADPEEAAIYAALAASWGFGDVYQVEPMDEPKPVAWDARGTSFFTTRAATVVAVVRRGVCPEEAASRMRRFLLLLLSEELDNR